MAQLIRRFPIQAGLAAFLLYLLTFSHGLTLHSLAVTAKIAGWDWLPLTGQPLLWLTTLPLRIFPSGWMPLLLNLMAALTGALVIGLLARTMEQLAWDRPLTQLHGWPRHLPVIFACAICGLEFNFWQQATSQSGEMLQLLIFAAAVWCLMEFRAGGSFGWLRAATLFWGAGMAENWMMLVTLPLFVVALLWLGKFRMLQVRTLLEFAGIGLAGFSVLALVPLANGFWPGSPLGMTDSWMATLRQFKSVLAKLYYSFWRAHRLAFIAVAIFYLVPLLTAVIRLRDEGTSNKAGVDRFQIWLYRGLLLAVLLACVWLVFNPVVGPQQIVLKQIGVTLPFLSLTYLLAICAGFLTGNLMLALKASKPDGYSRPGLAEKILARANVPFFIALLLVAIAGLLARNAAAITLANRLPLEQFGKLAAQYLPATSTVVLSDDPQRLAVFQSAATGTGKNLIAVDTQALSLPAYRHWLECKNPGIRLTATLTNIFSPLDNVQWLLAAAKSNQVYYLHPGFGYFFEAFYPVPEGTVYAFKTYSDRSVSPPPASASSLAAQEKFWAEIGPRLDAIQKNLPPKKMPRGSLATKINQRLHLQPAPAVQAQLLGEWYSLAVNDAGVQLQRAGQLKAAENLFVRAQALNPNNNAARVNQLANSNLQARVSMNLSAVEGITSQLSSLNAISRFLTLNGQIDEPAFCYILGSAFLRTGLPRQALQQFERASALAPTTTAPKFALAELYTRLGLGERARQCISEIRAATADVKERADLEATLSLLEADTWLAQTNSVNAREALQNLSGINPESPRTQNLVLRALTAMGDYTNALQIVQRQLNTQPNDIIALVNQAMIEFKMGATDASLKTIDRALAMTNAPDLRLLRNIARIQTGRLDEAEQDYLELQKTGEFKPAIFHGLAEIALQRRDTNRAVTLLEQCLSNLPAGSPQISALTNRIQQLKHP